MYAHDNIFKLYYQIGRTLPFEVRRYPDGRVSNWYHSQSVLVTKIEPKGEYGQAWGFYLKNGERDECYWCKKNDTEPQPIPCCGCGGWTLVDVKGSPKTKPDYDFNEKFKEDPYERLKPSDVIEFGKYKGKTLAYVYKENSQYLVWAESNVRNFYVDWDQLVNNEKDK